MKNKILILSLFILVLVSGCKMGKKDILRDLEKKYKNLNTYHIKGDLEIINNEDSFKYSVDVLYKKDDKYKVTLTNRNNNHEQIILKNEEGVYVLTPSLNKSFKFQSNWPYNNSQVYLVKSIIDDIRNDKERSVTEKDNNYIVSTKVNYPNNRKLINQVIRIDKDMKFKTIEVQDENGITYMKMNFKEIDIDPVIDNNTFKLDNIMKTKEDEKNNLSTTSNIDDVIYPLYIPSGTKLTSQEKIKKENGERILMTFDGEKSFMLVEETTSIPDEFEIVPTFGEPCVLTDTVAALTETSITWNSNNIDYYLVSDVMSQEELLDVARSISVIPTMK